MVDYQSSKNPTYSGSRYLEFMECASNYNKFIMKKIIDAAPKKLGLIAYDFGAGIGQFTDIWDFNQDQNVHIKAIELDKNFKKILKSKNILTIRLSSIKPMTADYIYSINVFEHIEDDEGCLKQLHTKLKPGGTLLIYVPAFKLLWTQMDNDVGHVRRYRRQDLREKVRLAGFRINSIEYADSAGFFATLLLRYINKKGGHLNKTLVILFDRLCFPVGRILDKLVCKHFFGKNLLVKAVKVDPILKIKV